jgi:hypothetical protein
MIASLQLFVFAFEFPLMALSRQSLPVHLPLLDELAQRRDLLLNGRFLGPLLGRIVLPCAPQRNIPEITKKIHFISSAFCPNLTPHLAGQWIWYRSRYDVCRRQRLASQADRILALSSWCMHDGSNMSGFIVFT